MKVLKRIMRAIGNSVEAEKNLKRANNSDRFAKEAEAAGQPHLAAAHREQARKYRQG
jgi:hypothetical protein